eukprot:Seg1738.7 transcript_id=Seg1738.7/GoldUCD/mRNA.D3Y31 product=Spondin-1 protein_id=Seg1738.7/GoldUCD/D3Y31
MNSKTILATALLLLVVVSLLVERSDGWRRRRRRRRRACSPVNCAVSAWTAWSTCTANCGATGSRSRSRRVIRGASCGGSCPYSLTGTRSCDCRYNSPAFGPCSKTCGTKGLKSRIRVIANPASCGKSCPSRSENVACNRVCCPKNCGLSQWSAWTTCTAKCGTTGTRSRTRTITSAASCGGTCSALSVTQPCNRVCCPVNCVVSKWGAWSTCSKTCGTTGTQSRTRTITAAASCGGTCLPLSATQPCNRVCCPVNCVHSWNPWSPCDCLGKRKRTLKTTPPKCGGAACPTKTVEEGSCTPIRTCVKGRCDVKTGNCKCSPGFKGTTCNTNCPKGTYGLQCKKKCSCSGRGTCHPSKGYCICPLYYFGKRCQYRYRCGRGYRCYRLKPRLITYHHCFLRVKLRRRFAACPRTHTPTECHCRAGCRRVRLRGRVCVCMCRRTNSAAVCCTRSRYLG